MTLVDRNTSGTIITSVWTKVVVVHGDGAVPSPPYTQSLLSFQEVQGVPADVNNQCVEWNQTKHSSYLKLEGGEDESYQRSGWSVLTGSTGKALLSLKGEKGDAYRSIQGGSFVVCMKHYVRLGAPV